jgi:hypothetical protein
MSSLLKKAATAVAAAVMIKRLAAGEPVVIHGHDDDALNGVEGTIAKYMEAKEVYEVKLSNGKAKRIKAENLKVLSVEEGTPGSPPKSSAAGAPGADAKTDAQPPPAAAAGDAETGRTNVTRAIHLTSGRTSGRGGGRGGGGSDDENAKLDPELRTVLQGCGLLSKYQDVMIEEDYLTISSVRQAKDKMLEKRLEMTPADIKTLRGALPSVDTPRRRSTAGAGRSSSAMAPPPPAEEHHDIKMPPKLKAFKPVQTDTAVTAAGGKASDLVKLEAALQLAVMSGSNKVSAAKDNMSSAVKALTKALREAIDKRVVQAGIVKVCVGVVSDGNEFFLGMYESKWKQITMVEEAGFEAYKAAVASIKIDSSITGGAKQRTGDPAILLSDAASIKTMYDTFMHDLVKGCGLNDQDDGVLSVPEALKKLLRILEKTMLVPEGFARGDVAKVCDVVRGMITVETMDEVVAIVNALVASGEIIIVRVKDRFDKSPSPGGWRDVMVGYAAAAAAAAAAPPSASSSSPWPSA